MAFLNEAGLERLWTHITTKLGDKVDKASGKVLSTNDYTDEDKNKLSTLKDLVGDTAVSEQIREAIAALVDSSPETLDTLNELAAALGDDPNFAATIAGQIGELENKIGDTSISEQINTAIINSQSDWNITDETNVSFIKNKPEATTDEEIINTMTSLGFSFSESENINVLTDENNNILLA